jgi:hypothetical protein
MGPSLVTRLALPIGPGAIAAFLSGYRLGLVVAAILVGTGGIAAWLALRNLPSTQKSTDEPRGVPAGDRSILVTD